MGNASYIKTAAIFFTENGRLFFGWTADLVNGAAMSALVAGPTVAVAIELADNPHISSRERHGWTFKAERRDVRANRKFLEHLIMLIAGPR